jgi:hypothetical protein
METKTGTRYPVQGTLRKKPGEAVPATSPARRDPCARVLAALRSARPPITRSLPNRFLRLFRSSIVSPSRLLFTLLCSRTLRLGPTTFVCTLSVLGFHNLSLIQVLLSPIVRVFARSAFQPATFSRLLALHVRLPTLACKALSSLLLWFRNPRPSASASAIAIMGQQRTVQENHKWHYIVRLHIVDLVLD